jgi:hypothetical protein
MNNLQDNIKVKTSDVPTVVGAFISFDGKSKCMVCKKSNLTFVFEVENSEKKVDLCEHCAILYSDSMMLVELLKKVMSKAAEFRGKPSQVYTWKETKNKKEVEELSVIDEIMGTTRIIAKTDKDSQYLSLNGMVYFVNYDKRDDSWKVVLNGKVKTPGTKRQMIRKSSSILNKYSTRSAAKLAVYDYQNERILTNIIKVYKDKGMDAVLECMTGDNVPIILV